MYFALQLIALIFKSTQLQIQRRYFSPNLVKKNRESLFTFLKKQEILYQFDGKF